MDGEAFSALAIASEKSISGAQKFAVKRYLYKELESASTKFYHGVYGLRGIGKTVLLLQLAARMKDSLYIPADAKYLIRESIYDLVKSAVANGYRNIFIDEIHARAGWTIDLKTLYDEGEANVFFTGSSSIEVKKGADLSRRVIMHELKPASFREYLNIKHNASVGRIKIAELLSAASRKRLAIKHSGWRMHLAEYYRYGGVLYEGIKEEFPKPITNALEKIVGVDLTYLRELDVKLENDIYRLLYNISESGPYEASYSKISSALGISKPTAIRIVSDLTKLGLLVTLFPCGGEFTKEPKIYLRIPFRQALNEMSSKKTDLGVMREEFFVNNVEADCYFKTKRGQKTPDFSVGNKIIEVGVSGKESNIADYIAIDGASFTGNKIPLFLFGFLY